MNNLEEKLLSLYNKEVEKAQKETQEVTVDKSSELPVETPSEVAEVTEEPVKQVAEEVQKEQEPEKKEEVVEETPTPTSWDDDETEVVTSKEPVKPDYKKIGSALDLEDGDEDKIVAKVSELKSKLKQLEEAPIEAIPDDFKEIVKAAKAGEDWKGLLSEMVVDFTKVDPYALVEDDFMRAAPKNPKFYVDGKFNAELAEQAFEEIPDAVKWDRGLQIQQALHNQQRSKIAEAVQRAESRRVAAETTLATATKDLSQILPVETHGIQFEPKHSAQLYQGISNSNLTKKHLGITFDDLVRSGADMKQVTRTVALAEYGEKMLKYKSQNAEVKTKKEILAKTQNAQIKPSSTVVNPEPEGSKPKSNLDLMKEHFAAQRSKF